MAALPEIEPVTSHGREDGGEDGRTGGGSPRVALLLETDGPGGAEWMLLHLAEELRRRGREVVAVGPAHRKGWLGARFRERGFETATFRLRGPLDPGCLLHLVRLLRRRRIDVVHSHEFALAVYGAAAASMARLPHVLTMHGGRYYAERWRRRAALRWAIRRSRAAVAVSKPTREEMVSTLGVPRDRIRVIPNGIPAPGGRGERIRRELELARDEPLVLAVGNLYPVKGHAVLVEALARLHGTAPDRAWRLAIAGRGEEEDALRRRARRGGIAHRVHLLGYRDDVDDLLAAARIFALPSRSEGLPLALLEAMHAGKTIVASGVGGVPQAVTAGREALLVPPGDPGALAAALGAVLGDAALRRRLSVAARTRARARYSVEAMTDAYEELYGWEPTDDRRDPSSSDPPARRPLEANANARTSGGPR